MPRLRSNEWNFAANAATMMTELLARAEYADSPLGHAEPELGELRSARRLDLVIFSREREGEPLVTGELKPPYVAEGRNPHAPALRDAAFQKASAAGALYFITWNIRRVVVWKTDDPGVALADRVVYDEEIIGQPIRSADDVRRADVRESLQKGVKRLLDFLSSVISGRAAPNFLPLDRIFIGRLEAALYFPIDETYKTLRERMDSDRTFRVAMERWMREEQRWIVSSSTQEENLERAARFTCYVLVNRLCFYNALRRKYPDLSRLAVANNVTTGEALERRLRQAFDGAKRYTGNYEPVFDGAFGDTLPFVADSAVAEWRKLIRSLDHYDFAALNVEVIGSMYEQLIRPEERHRYGQHYTQPAVVDLINSFAIRTPDARVLDPGCGGGTFLVRSYVRKKRLDPRQHHVQLLEAIYGCDLLQYACHLSTINLAVRDLIDDDNFPRLHHGDFLRLEPGGVFQTQPVRIQAGGLPTAERVIPIEADSFDAVVGNPPYITARQMSAEDREAYRDIAAAEWPGYGWSLDFDIYPYFWTHGAVFLRQGGYLALLTQAAWLDVEYGIPVQHWMLNHFKVVAVMETDAEPWFTDARVATVVTILQREDDRAARDANTVRFVRFRSRLTELVSGADDAIRLQKADQLRDEILAATRDHDAGRYGIRLIPQSDLLASGTAGDGTYGGSKWGRYLRSIQVLYELQRTHRQRLGALVNLARVDRGATTNCDDFFIVNDVSRGALTTRTDAGEFRLQYAVPRAQVVSGQVSIIRRDDGVEFALESFRLKRILKTGRNLAWFATSKIQDTEHAVYIDENRDALPPLALRYVEAGEREGWHESPSFQAMMATGRNWYTLREREVAPILFIKTMQYVPLVFWNDGGLLANQRLYKVVPQDGVDPLALCAVLNSTVMAAERYAAVKALGREAAIDAEVFTVRTLRTPDLRRLGAPDIGRLQDAMRSLCTRQAGPMLEEGLRDAGLAEACAYATKHPMKPDLWPAELKMEDRRQIDEIVLTLIGVSRREVSEKKDRFYQELTDHLRQRRLLELEAQINRRGSGVSAEPSTPHLADEAWGEVTAAGRLEVRRLPTDFLLPNAATRSVQVPVSRRVVVQSPGLFDGRRRFSCQIGTSVLEFEDARQAEYVAFLARSGVFGNVPVPEDFAECARTTAEMSDYLGAVSAALRRAAINITGHPESQAKIVREAMKRVTRH